MNEVLLSSVILILLIILILLWLIFEHYKLKKKLAFLQQYMEQQQMDLSALCETAVIVDSKVLKVEESIKQPVEHYSVPLQQQVVEAEIVQQTEEIDPVQVLAEEPPVDEQELEVEQEADSEQFVQPYQQAIQAVKQGMDVEQLMQDFALSRDEALLLIRLHGCKG